MAISTLAGAESGLIYPTYFAKGVSTVGFSAVSRSLFGFAGNPPAGSVGAPGLAGTALTGPVTGQVPLNTPVSGNSYLGEFRASYMPGTATTAGGALILADRLWHNSGLVVSITTSQAIGSVTWPARDNNGATLGEGVYIGMEVTTAAGVGAPVCQISYTNSAGTAGRLGTPIQSVQASAVAGVFWIFGLQTGDTGVRQVEAFSQTSSMASGAVSLVAFRPVAMVVADRSVAPGKVDAITGGFGRWFDGSVPFFISHANSVGGGENWTGVVNFSQG